MRFTHQRRTNLLRLSAGWAMATACIALASAVSAAGGAARDRQLFEAVERGDAVRCRELIRDGASIWARDALGRTPLLAVCTSNPGQEAPSAARLGARLDVVRILVAAKADVNARNRESGTALMGAAGSRGTDLELLKLLLRSGAKVNLRDRLDQTALMFASGAYGHPEAARLLLAAGADIRAEDWEGHTALWRATSSRRPEIVQILRQSGARE